MQQAYVVSGLTFAHKESLKVLGFRFDRPNKLWLLPRSEDGDTEAKITTAVGAMKRVELKIDEIDDGVITGLFGAKAKPATVAAATRVSVSDSVARAKAAQAAITAPVATPVSPRETPAALPQAKAPVIAEDKKQKIMAKIAVVQDLLTSLQAELDGDK